MKSVEGGSCPGSVGVCVGDRDVNKYQEGNVFDSVTSAVGSSGAREIANIILPWPQDVLGKLHQNCEMNEEDLNPKRECCSHPTPHPLHTPSTPDYTPRVDDHNHHI